VRDVVRNLFHRLGTVGVILLASALLFGVLAGAVVVHRLDTAPSASSESAQNDKAGQQNDKQTQPAKSKHTQQGQSTSGEQDDS
jgi:uncharacterized membrane protein